MRYYAEGSIISRELEQMMHQDAADARFEVGLSGYEDNYALMRRKYASAIRAHKPRKESQ